MRSFLVAGRSSLLAHSRVNTSACFSFSLSRTRICGASSLAAAVPPASLLPAPATICHTDKAPATPATVAVARVALESIGKHVGAHAWGVTSFGPTAGGRLCQALPSCRCRDCHLPPSAAVTTALTHACCSPISSHHRESAPRGRDGAVLFARSLGNLDQTRRRRSSKRQNDAKSKVYRQYKEMDDAKKTLNTRTHERWPTACSVHVHRLRALFPPRRWLSWA
eukprot:COSAG05_NODE_8486_length_699_cov_1.003333_1_plen_222_part_10